MINNDSLIFVLEDDKSYGKLIQIFLGKQGFSNVRLFYDEMTCLNNFHLYPTVLITDYHMKYMTGLKLIENARRIHPCFHTILLTGVYNTMQYGDEISVQSVDKFIIKGENALNQLSHTLNEYLNPTFNSQFY